MLFPWQRDVPAAGLPGRGGSDAAALPGGPVATPTAPLGRRQRRAAAEGSTVERVRAEVSGCGDTPVHKTQGRRFL